MGIKEFVKEFKETEIRIIDLIDDLLNRDITRISFVEKLRKVIDDRVEELAGEHLI